MEISKETIEIVKANNTLELKPPAYELRDIRIIPTKKGGEFTIIEVFDCTDQCTLEFFEREVYAIDGPSGLVKIQKSALKAAQDRAENRRRIRKEKAQG